MRAELQ